MKEWHNSHIISAAVVCMVTFAAVYIMTFYAPLYVDDAHWPIQNSRIIYDDYKLINLYSQCVSNFSKDVPWPLLPGRTFSALLHPDTVMGTRISGMLKYLCCIGLLTAIAYFMLNKAVPAFALMAGITSFLSLGSIPIVMTFNRPESSIVIGISLLVLLYLASKRLRCTLGSSVLIACAFIGILSWLLSHHPKTQMLIPAIIILAVLTRVSSPKIKFLLLLATLCMSISCIMFWRGHAECRESLQVRRILSYHSLLPADLTKDPEYFFERALDNLAKAPIRYTKVIKASPVYMGYLKQFAEYMPQENIFHILLSAINTIVFIVSISLVVMLAVLAYPDKNITNRYRALQHWVIPIALMLIVAFLVITRSTSSVAKEMGLISCLLLLSIAWYASCVQLQTICPKLIRRCLTAIILLGIVNHIAFAGNYYKLFQYTGQANNFQNGSIPEASWFQSIADADTRERNVLHAAQQCDITPESAHHLVVDDFTYMPFRKSYQPFYGRMLFTFSGMKTRNNMAKFLLQNQSTGVVALCKTIPAKLRGLSYRYMNICCINRDMLMTGTRY